MSLRICIRGAGDLASGVAARVYRAGWSVLMTEIAQPVVVRRTVSFAEAVYRDTMSVEGIPAVRVSTIDEVLSVIERRAIAVMVDPEAQCISEYCPDVLIDARMRKQPPEFGLDIAPCVIGLGPGFIAGLNCHAVIETKRGHALGRVIWDGSAENDTGIPETVGEFQAERVLRAPRDGIVSNGEAIGASIRAGDIVVKVEQEPVTARFNGILRGVIHDGVYVQKGMKIGDIDPRCDPAYCVHFSDKALAIGGGVLEAILSVKMLRSKLYG